jgi:hypothetical protein
LAETILPDYNALIREAKKRLEDEHPFLVMDQIINERIREQISEHFAKEDIFIHRSNTNLKDFLAGRVLRKGIIIGDLLAVQVERYVDNSNILVLSGNNATDLLLPDTRRITVSNRRKAEVAICILTKLLRLEYDENSHTRILLLPDPPAGPGL